MAKPPETEKQPPKLDSSPILESESEDKKARRIAVRSILIGSGLAAGSKVIPDKWVQPIVESVVLPTHAESSPVSGPSQSPPPPSPPPPSPPSPPPPSPSPPPPSPPPPFD